MSTLSFQPDAERYYAEGYWRPGDLWSDFAARADENPGKAALILDDRQVTYDQLRRAAVGAQGHRALEQHVALRDRGHLPALGAQRRGHLPRRLRVRLRRWPGLRLLPRPAQRGDRGAREPLERRGRAAPRRGAPLHLRA